MSRPHLGLTVIFGGAFDPVHFGHIKPALELLKHPEIEQIRFLPCRVHPDKQLAADDGHRAAMLRLIAHSAETVVDMHELQRDEISCTSQTLESIRGEIGTTRPLAFLLGQDAFLDIEAWHQYRRIPELAHLIVLLRDGDGIPDSHPLIRQCGGWSSLPELVRAPAGKLCLFDNKTVELSSSGVRDCLVSGNEPRYLIPGAVWQYIQRHHLYGR